MKCGSCNADMADGHKFCAGCGHKREADDDKMEKAVCGACQHEQLATHKRCCECGEDLLKSATDREYDAALEAMGQMAKSNAELPSTITLPPAKTPGAREIDFSAIHAGSDTEVLDAGPLLKAVTEAQNRLHDSIESRVMGSMDLIATDVRAARIDEGKRGEVMLKAFTALGQKFIALGRQITGLESKVKALESENGELRKSVDTLSNQRLGRRSAVVIHPKDNGAATGTETKGEGDDDSLFGDELMSKAAVAHLRAPDALTGDELARLEMWKNAGLTLNGIRQNDPQLAQRFDQAVAQGTTH